LFVVLVSPFPLQRLCWLAGSRHVQGRVYFEGHHWDIYGSVSSHMVVIFDIGRDSVVFTNNINLKLRDNTPVPVRYEISDPQDARVDVPVCIWGDTLVYMLLPFGVWLILFLTPNGLDPVIPWGSKVLLRRRKPYIKVIWQRESAGSQDSLLPMVAAG
jgi:hypothetical protein